MSTIAMTDNKPLRHTGLAMTMWALGALFYFYEFLLNVSPGVMVNDMMSSFNTSAKMVSTMASIYLWVYGLMQIPVGVLLDRFGPRRLLTAATAACALGAYVFSIANGLHLAYIGRALLGFGGAFAIVGCMKIIANWFAPERFALMLGCVLFIGMFGAVFGDAPLALMVSKYEWRGSLQILGAIGVVLMLVIFFVMRDEPSTGKMDNSEEHHISDEHPLQSIQYIVANKQTWLASIYGALMFAPTLAFGGLWGVPFIQHSYGMSKTVAAGYVSWIFIGWAIGSPLVGWISDYIGRRKTTMYAGSLGALALMTVIIYVPNLSHHVLATAMFGLGVFSSGFLMAFPLVKEINPHRYNATALGFINTLNTFGGAVLQPVIGIILDMLWTGQKIAGVPDYSTEHYQWALSPLLIAIFASILFLPFIRETYCKHIED